MAGSFGSASDEDLISGINITPLVDVVLVLLIIFMITAPTLYNSTLKIQLPKAKTGEKSVERPLAFSITKEGAVTWGKETMDWKTLHNKLGALGKTAAHETASISADTATPHGTVIRLMDMLREVGLMRFALNVETRTK